MKSDKPRRQPSNGRSSKTNKQGTKPARKPAKNESVWRIAGSDDEDKPKRSTSVKPSKPGKQTRTVGNKTTRNYGRNADEQTTKPGSRSRATGKKYPTDDERPQRDGKSTSTVRNRRYNDDKPKKIVIRGKKSSKDEVRLNKFIANSGICSRREADEFISAGVVTVNGVVVSELGTKVKSTDDIRFNGQRLQGEKKVYILLNKPKGYVTTMEDPHADKTVMDLIAGACTERVYPVGRLDKNTTGVLLFTNDGELTKLLTHPSSEKIKIYHAFLDKKVSLPDLSKLVEGFDLEDGFIQADSAEFANADQTEVGIEIHSGRNRIVRRMFEHMGYKVTRLDRVYFAGLTKKGLKRGEWRILSPKEVNILKIGSFK